METRKIERKEYRTPQVQLLEVQTEGFLATSAGKYQNWNDGEIGDIFNDLGNF